MNAYLQTQDLSVGYDGKALIQNVCLEIQKGKIVTLIGPNGSGKSTILKTIVGQLRKISGTVLVEDAAMDRLSRREIAQKMAIVMTERIHPELMTCRDVVATGRYPYTGALGLLGERDKEVVQASLDRVNAGEIAERPSAMASGRESCLPEPCARSRRSLSWMSRPATWISAISWNC